jgi:hypothetical protein
MVKSNDFLTIGETARRGHVNIALLQEPWISQLAARIGQSTSLPTNDAAQNINYSRRADAGFEPQGN